MVKNPSACAGFRGSIPCAAGHLSPRATGPEPTPSDDKEVTEMGSLCAPGEYPSSLKLETSLHSDKDLPSQKDIKNKTVKNSCRTA